MDKPTEYIKIVRTEEQQLRAKAMGESPEEIASLKAADKEYGLGIIYGHLSSCGIDRLLKRAEENRERTGHRDYFDLARFVYGHPL